MIVLRGHGKICIVFVNNPSLLQTVSTMEIHTAMELPFQKATVAITVPVGKVLWTVQR